MPRSATSVIIHPALGLVACAFAVAPAVARDWTPAKAPQPAAHTQDAMSADEVAKLAASARTLQARAAAAAKAHRAQFIDERPAPPNLVAPTPLRGKAAATPSR